MKHDTNSRIYTGRRCVKALFRLYQGSINAPLTLCFARMRNDANAGIKALLRLY
jgi:hypothetical protein